MTDILNFVCENVTGFILGVFSALVVSFMRNALTTSISSLNRSYAVYKFLAKILFFTGNKILLNGKWNFYWVVNSKNFKKENLSPFEVKSFFNIIIGEWSAEDNDGTTHTYRLVGLLKSDKFEGKWFDKSEDLIGYHGMFQTIVSPTKNKIKGKWIGFGSNNEIKVGDLVIKQE